MNWIVTKIKWIMLVSGVLTFTMVYAAIAPQAALQTTFGQVVEGPVAEIVVRNWGALIAVVGGMLIYGAFNAANRRAFVTVAVITKSIFIGLVLIYGRQFLGHQAGIAVAGDLVIVVLFVLYLIGARRESSEA